MRAEHFFFSGSHQPLRQRSLQLSVGNQHIPEIERDVAFKSLTLFELCLDMLEDALAIKDVVLDLVLREHAKFEFDAAVGLLARVSAKEDLFGRLTFNQRELLSSKKP